MNTLLLFVIKEVGVNSAYGLVVDTSQSTIPSTTADASGRLRYFTAATRLCPAAYCCSSSVVALPSIEDRTAERNPVGCNFFAVSQPPSAARCSKMEGQYPVAISGIN